MKWDLLLEWMTHLGSGRWEVFRNAVKELADDDEPDVQMLAWRLRRTLSDMGHVDYSSSDDRRWQVLRPALVELTTGGHLFVGGRNRQLTEALILKAQGMGCAISISEPISDLSRFSVEGPQDGIQDMAEALSLEYVPKVSILLASRLPSLRSLLADAPECPEPVNWDVRSWSFEAGQWISGRFPRTARLYTSRYGDRRYMIHLGAGDLRELDKRVSIYVAALLKGWRIVHYFHHDKRLLVPRWAPLPEVYSRVACLAGGQLSTVQGDSLIFEPIDHNVASMLLINLGQGYPASGDVS